MRNINTIVIHHSATPSTQTIEKSMSSFDNTHKERLYEAYQQPLSNSDYKYIAYHFCVDRFGTVKSGRSLDVAGYHASNYPVNLESIGICMIGNFDEERATSEQFNAVYELIKKLKKEFPEINTLEPHRKYASKTCPGINFTDSLVEELREALHEPVYDAWINRAILSAKESGLTTKGDRPLDPMLRVEYWESERKKAL